MRRSLPALLALIALACDDGGSGDAQPSPDGGAPDAAPPDAGAPPPADAGNEPSDAGDAGPPDGSDAGAPDANPPDPRYRTTLDTPEDFAALQAEAGGEVKFLLPVRGRPARPPLTANCYFQDMGRFEWHLQFLRSFPEFADLSTEAYAELVLREVTRAWWAGAIQLWPGVAHPETGRLGIVSFTVYAATDEGLGPDPIIEVHDRLASCAPFARDLLVYVPADLRQQQDLPAMRAALAAGGVASLFPRDLVRDLASVAYSPGEGYGYLRVVPRGERLEGYGPRDVVVVQAAPNDISVVAGLITADPQKLHSHVNLRLREKGVPNAAVPDIYESDLVVALDGALVHLVVSETGVTLEPARLADAEAFWESRRPQIGEPVADLTVREMAAFADLGAGDADAYGAKAANLAELWHILPPDHRAEGFAIPFAHGRDHLAAHGIDARIEALLADERLRTDRHFKREALEDLRREIRKAPLAPAFFAALSERITAVFGPDGVRTKLRFRSSTNAEDLDELSGAGLYDSRSGCLADDLDGDEEGPSACLDAATAAALQARLAARRAELVAHPERTWLHEIIEELEEDLTEEQPVAEAVPKVWASLWNERAFDERELYGLDHRRVYMGIAVNAAFVEERASAVAITNLTPDDGPPLYRLVSQAGEESVVRPEDLTAVPEVLTFRRVGDPPEMTDIRVLVPSSLAPDGVWPEDALRTLGGLLFDVHDHFEAAVYPDVRPLRLDLEVKLTRDGRVVLKQARPYVSAEP